MKKQILVLILCSIGYLLSLMSRSCPATLSDYLIQDFAFNATNLGLVSASTMISYGFMQLPAGVLADRFGSRTILIIFTLIAGISTLCFAFANTQWQVILSRFFIGIGVSLSVISITMVSLWFHPKNFAKANSILCAISEFGPVLAASPLVFAIELFTWRYSMAGMGFMLLGLSFCWYFCIPKETPNFEITTNSIHKNKDNVLDKKKQNTQINLQKKSHWKESIHGIACVLKTPSFYPLAFWQMLATGAIYVMATLWLVPYFMETAGYSLRNASYILSIAGIFLIGIQASVGFLSDMLFKSRKKVLILISISFLIASSMLVFGVGKLNYTFNMLLGILLMSGVAGSNICNTMVKETFPRNLTGTALGCFNMFYPIWTALMQVLFGFLITYAFSKDYSIDSAYQIACSIILICAIAALICSFLAKETFQKL